MLILGGLLTRVAALLLLVDIAVAIATTKIPILVARGFFAMEDPARTDYAMLMSLVLLLLVGARRWSVDAWAAGTPPAARPGATRERPPHQSRAA